MHPASPLGRIRPMPRAKLRSSAMGAECPAAQWSCRAARPLGSASFALAWSAGTPPSAAAPATEQNPNSDCLDCHSDKTLTKTQRRGQRSARCSWTKPRSRARSTDQYLRRLPRGHHAPSTRTTTSPAQPPSCAKCHEHGKPSDYASQHSRRRARAMGASGAASCWDCHGTHNILPAKNPDSPVFKLNLPQTCATCHSNPGLTQGIPDEVPAGGVAVHGQHPRAGAC